MRNSGGVAETMAEQMEDNVGGRFIILKSALEGLFIGVFDSMKVGLGGLLISFTGLVEKTTAWVKANQETVGAIMGIVGAIAGFLAGGGALLLILGSLGGAIAGISSAFTAIAAVGLPVIGAAIAAVIPIIVGLVAAFFLIKAAWNELKDLGLVLWNVALKPLWEGFKQLIGFLVSMFTPVWNFVVEQFKKAILRITQVLEKMTWLKTVFKALGVIIGVLIANALLPLLAPLMVILCWRVGLAGVRIGKLLPSALKD